METVCRPQAFGDRSAEFVVKAESLKTSLHGQWPVARSVEDLRENLKAVDQRIEAACLRAGRDASSVRLLPVSKTMSADVVRMAWDAGCRTFGENKVQEAYAKWSETKDLADLRWAVIGHLQTNKAKLVADFADEFHALDSLRVAQALDARLQAIERTLTVFVQVNTSGEASKYGLSPQDVPAFVRELRSYPTLKVRGLMTLAMFSDDEARVRACFSSLRRLRDQLRADVAENAAICELSMGMSGDFEVAIEEGATVVRVGQAIFGARALPDSYYWPTTGNG